MEVLSGLDGTIRLRFVGALGEAAHHTVELR
jgi:hypothetical protein